MSESFLLCHHTLAFRAKPQKLDAHSAVPFNFTSNDSGLLASFSSEIFEKVKLYRPHSSTPAVTCSGLRTPAPGGRSGDLLLFINPQTSYRQEIQENGSAAGVDGPSRGRRDGDEAMLHCELREASPLGSQGRLRPVCRTFLPLFLKVPSLRLGLQIRKSTCDVT